jgi:hypothetical protein
VRRKIAIFTLVILAAGIGSGYFYFQIIASPKSCQSMGINHVTRTNLSSLVRFDAITEYPLPNPNRMPNAVTVAPDGSVWFGEQTVPGVAHLLSNGTLIEYEWPSSTWRPQTDQGLCGVYKTGIWGIALWNGMV